MCPLSDLNCERREKPESGQQVRADSRRLLRTARVVPDFLSSKLFQFTEWDGAYQHPDVADEAGKPKGPKNAPSEFLSFG